MKAVHLPASDRLLVLACGDEIDESVLNDLLMDCHFKRIPMGRRVMTRYRTYALNAQQVEDRRAAEGIEPHPDEIYWNYRTCYKRSTLEAMWARLHGASWKEDVLNRDMGSGPGD